MAAFHERFAANEMAASVPVGAQRGLADRVLGIRDKRTSVIVVGLLDGTLTAEILLLRREDPVAALLLAPYLAWSGFATALNIAVSDPG